MEYMFFGGFLWIALFIYGMWLLIFPILLYSRMGDILMELKRMGRVGEK